MLSFLEASLVMIVRLLEVARILVIAIAILLFIQFITYNLSNRKINLYKTLNKKINYLLRF